MKKIVFNMLTVSIVSIASFSGCATVLKGYFDDVQLSQIPNGVKIFTKEGIELPITKTEIIKQVTYYSPGRGRYDSLVDRSKYTISLRSNTDHTLVIKTPEYERTIHLYPHISAGWFALDLVTLTFWVDMYTGNWNHFHKIDLSN